MSTELSFRDFIKTIRPETTELELELLDKVEENKQPNVVRTSTRTIIDNTMKDFHSIFGGRL